MRLEECDTYCYVVGCSTTVCLAAEPEAMCDQCGDITCRDCVHDCPNDLQETPC